MRLHFCLKILNLLCRFSGVVQCIKGAVNCPWLTFEVEKPNSVGKWSSGQGLFMSHRWACVWTSRVVCRPERTGRSSWIRAWRRWIDLKGICIQSWNACYKTVACFLELFRFWHHEIVRIGVLFCPVYLTQHVQVTMLGRKMRAQAHAVPPWHPHRFLGRYYDSMLFLSFKKTILTFRWTCWIHCCL